MVKIKIRMQIKMHHPKVRLELLNSEPAITRLALETGDPSLCDGVSRGLWGSYPKNTVHSNNSNGRRKESSLSDERWILC